MPLALATWGEPAAADLLRCEVLPPQGAGPSRILDLAVGFRWPDGRHLVVTLLEHWSNARRVDLRRVLLYAADLAQRHPEAVIEPIILVTDPRAITVDGNLAIGFPEQPRLQLNAQVIHLRHEQADSWRGLANRVACVFQALAPAPNPIDHLLHIARAFARAPGAPEDIVLFLPFMAMIARLTGEQRAEFEHRLYEDPAMTDIFTRTRELGIAEGEARGIAVGEARGEARASINLVRDLVAKGRLTVDEGHAELDELVTRGLLTTEMATAAKAQLG